MPLAKPDLPSLTTVVAVDQRYLRQFREVWANWVQMKPDLLTWPLLIICDRDTLDSDRQPPDFRWTGHPDCRAVPWDWPANGQSRLADDITQRERMLTAFVRIPPAAVNTNYWLKIDTDAIATAPGPWIFPEWFLDTPSIVASPWSYTKPGQFINRMETWANGLPLFSHQPALGLHCPADQECLKHKRIASWICFVNTLFSRLALDLVRHGRLPVPSQDTYHWYVAKRLGHPIVRAKFKNLGWGNVHSDRARTRLLETLAPKDIPLTKPPPPQPRGLPGLIGLVLDRFPDWRPLPIVEVGVWKAENAVRLLEMFPDISMTLVDPWLPAKNTREFAGFGRGVRDQDAKGMEAVYSEVMAALEPFVDRVTVLRKSSREAAAECDRFTENPPALVYIDANHDYQAVVDDIAAWRWCVDPAPRFPGGILCGHDYTKHHPGVVQAVDEAGQFYERKIHSDRRIWWMDFNE